MLSLVTLFFASALLLCAPANAHIIADSKMEMENQLTPHEPPPPRRKTLEKFVRIPDPLQTTKYTDKGMVVKCEVVGKPAPSVVWMKNGVPIVDYEEETNEIRATSPASVARLTSKLVVPSSVNGDVYTCVGVSGLKETSSSIIYEEDGESDTLPAISKPIITEFYNEVFQAMGTSITLPCRVSSSSHYQVVWLDNQEKIVYGNPRIRVLPSGDLHISNLVWEDMGEYTCTAKNIYGKVFETTFLYPNKP